MSWYRLAALVRNVVVPGRAPDGIRIDLEDIESASGKLRGRPREREGTGLLVERGDVLVGKLRPNLRKSLGVVTPGACSPEFLVLRPGPRLESRYLAYVVQSDGFVDAAVSSTDGAKMPRTSFEKLRAARVFVPDLDAQIAVADYLDVETARIDRVIEKRRALADLSTMRLRAVVEETFSAVEHRRLKFGLRVPPDYGASETSDSGDELWPRFIRITDIDDQGQLRPSDVRRLAPSIARPYLLSDGDVLVARSGATVGKAFRYVEDRDGPACFAGYLIRLRSDARRLLSGYLLLATQSRSWWAQVGQAVDQATIQNVSAAKYAEFVVPMPDIETQDATLRRVTPLLEAHRALTRAINSQIALLRERRQALITVAVTGRLQVPGAVVANAAA